MSDFVLYLFKSGVLLSIFYLLYMIFLRKETFYGVNRIYLLATLIISFVLPFINIEFSQATILPVNNFEYVEHVFLEANESLEYAELKTAESIQSFPVILILLLIGIVLAAIRTGYQLFVIFKNVKRYDVKTLKKYTYVLMDNGPATHSFFNFIFVQKSDFNKKQIQDVIAHEQIHADKWHSVDLLLVGFLSILQWFNPFIYLFKRALTETHEFQADQALLDGGTDKLHYQKLLLDQARSVVFAGLTSNFNQSLIKNRLKMMNKIKSSNKAIVKYVTVFPIVFFVGIFMAISQEKIEHSLVEVINISNDGDTMIGESDFAILDMPEDNRINVYADEMVDFPTVVRMKGNVRLETFDKSIKVSADNILINKEDRKLYAFTDDYVPSISPIDESNLKRIPSGFGMRMHPILKVERMHNGSDFSADAGTPVLATANGTVRDAETDEKYGKYVIIDHGNGFSTAYMHMSEIKVKKGESVNKGATIGLVGNTGMSSAPHLHYEVMKDGKYVDPANYLGETPE